MGNTVTGPNIFNSLFQFHPREGMTPKENYLTEAFAHVLRTCPGACDAWVSLALGRPVELADVEVTTRPGDRGDDDSTCFPDLLVSGIIASGSGERVELYSEHKWNSPCNPAQLRKYLKSVQKHGDHVRLAFVGASRKQKKAAEEADPRMAGRAFLWSDVHRAIASLEPKPDLLTQFLDFMASQGLGPVKPIDPTTMLAFLRSSGFVTTLEHMAHKLNDEFEWDFLPARYLNAPEVTNRWGRVAIELTTPGWKPSISAGFLYEERDHQVSFVNPAKGIDLMLRLESRPRDQTRLEPVMAELGRRRARLAGLAASVLLHRERGNGNRHSLLIVRSCLGEVIEGAANESAQLDTIHGVLRGWATTLFGDGALEEALKRAGLDGGM